MNRLKDQRKHASPACSASDCRSSRLPEQKGFTLIATAVCLIALVSVAGLAVDLGRAFITKNEAQAFADAAAISAARELNGKSTGITNAQAAVTTARSADLWNLGTTAFTVANTTVDFATTANGPWVAAPANPPVGYGFVRVTASPNLPVFLLPVVGSSTSLTVSARSVAGVVPQTFPRGGYLPFTPFAHSMTDPDYGFVIGQAYTVLWPGNVRVGPNGCAGDNTQQWIDNANAGGGGERGYFELQSASSISAAILGQKQLTPLSVGDIVNLTNGQKQAEQNALETLAGRDTDLTDYQPIPGNPAATGYHGNGVRLVVMPINSGFTGDPAHIPPILPNQVLGFATFLLPMTYGNSGNKSWCMIYMGSKSAGSDGLSPYTGAGAYVTKLVQ
ncbi:MAG: pilus assembly protein TadG-related protein [Bryobacteraceae bacterium]